jgi:hypothetical protein
LDGWRYGFLQGAHKQRESLKGKTVNVRLYTIKPSKERLYVGVLKSAEVLDDETASQAVESLRRGGYLAKMKQEISQVGGDPTALALGPARTTVNIRIRPDSLRIYGTPVAAKPIDKILRFNRYSMILAGSHVLKEWAERTRRAWTTPPSTDPITYRLAARLVKVNRIERKMQKEIKHVLEKKYGKGKVEAERNFRDLMLTTANRRVLIEIKASQSARQAIRNAFGQLLDYAYFANRNKEGTELVVIGAGPPTPETGHYLQRLKDQFCLEIKYRQYPIGSHRLDL